MFSDPVVGDKFFGRNDVLGALSKRVNGLKDGYRQNIAIVGPKLIGKSSLILHFLTNLNHPNIVPIYIDLRPNSFQHFTHKFLGTLLYHYLKNKNIKPEEEVEILKERAKKDIPKIIEIIRSIENSIRNQQLKQAYEILLNLTSIFKQETGNSCIVILDEFHLLDTYKIPSPFSSLAKEIMMQKDTMYILISSQVSYAKRVLANELSLLFGNFEVIYLKPFDYVTCCKFLEKRFQDINLSQNFRDFIIGFTEGYPFYLDILSKKLLEKARELNKSEISYSLLSQAFNSLIYDSQGIFNQYFTSLLSYNLNGVDYSNFIPILMSTAERGRQLNNISEDTNRHPKIISKQINYLLDKDLLSKVGVFYRIQDKIFRFWLKSVYRRKNLSLTADPLTESKDFSREIEEQILKFSLESKKKLTERIIDLFKSFRNEIVWIQNKSFRLWHFEEVRLWFPGNLQDCIIARYKDGYWACLIRKENIDEAQVQEFIQSCKKSKYKIRRTIIIALKELDLNVRLTALEKKVWIWSLADLNLILDLYGKQQIVH